MAGFVQLIKGDLFDGPSDLVVLPCSTAGTFTSLVAQKLRLFSIPAPRSMALGEVEIHPLQDAAHVAQFAAFAASVAGFKSTPDAIQKIGAALGRATEDRTSIRVINAPLLGAGAGGIQSETVVERLRNGFLAEAAEGAALNIYVRHDDVYRRVLTTLPLLPPKQSAPEHPPDQALLPASDHGGRPPLAVEPPPPDFGEAGPYISDRRPIRVLISYTRTSDEHREWVLALYKYLRENGIDARVDEYSLRPGGDVVQWMCNELEMADRVLLICDERYGQRADGRHGGVGWETMIVQGGMYREMYESDRSLDQSRYVPIVRTPDPTIGLPKFLTTKLWIHWPPEANDLEKQRSLLEELYGVRREPPLGPPPVFV